MLIEAIMICLDNSEFMRNGDYKHTRFEAQNDVVCLIMGAKHESSPENAVGVLTMAGKGVRVLVTPTSDLGDMLGVMFGLDIGGETNLVAGIQVAQLALKHRLRKNLQQRIILFAGSPIKQDKKVLEMIGRKLKKNSVALDVVNFGEKDEGKAEKLEALVAAVNNNDSSHIFHIPPGPSTITGVLLSTHIFIGDGEPGNRFAARAARRAARGVSGIDFGVDPNLDPELALALQVSMEEERDRQEAAVRAVEEAVNRETGVKSTSKDVAMAENVSAVTSETGNRGADLMDDENALLQQALAMSTDDSYSNITTQYTDMSEATSEDQDLALALQLSVQENSKDDSNQTDLTILLLPGVDPNNPSVKDLLASMQGQPEQKGEDKEQKEDKK